MMDTAQIVAVIVFAIFIGLFIYFMPESKPKYKNNYSFENKKAHDWEWKTETKVTTYKFEEEEKTNSNNKLGRQKKRYRN